MERTHPSTSRYDFVPTNDELASRARMHGVHYSVTQHQVATAENELVRRGWIIDVYGACAEGEGPVEDRRGLEAVHDVLADVLTATLPPSSAEVGVHVDPFVGAIHMGSGSEDVHEVRIRIVFEPHTETTLEQGAKLDTEMLDGMRSRLATLGIHQTS
jgi:hypothetical protein